MSSLKRILCARIPQPNRPTELAEAEATHATRVLRLTDGDLVEAMDGKGNAAIAKLRTRNGPTRLEFSEQIANSSDSDSQLVPVILEMSVLKGDAMEWVVEKSVELGVTRLFPVLTAHTVVQMDRKGPEAFRERWQKIADQALKQCGRLARLEVEVPISMEDLIRKPIQGVRLWCDEQERAQCPPLLSWLETSRPKNFSPLHILIGPEGGWSANERELLAREDASKIATVSLGPLVLRAETAAISALSIAASDMRLRMTQE